MRSIDYHMHTRFSGDSEADPREHVIQAIKMGLDEICFTDHRDFDYPIDVFDLDVEGYYQTIMALKKEFADKIIIKWGIEIGLDMNHQLEINNLINQYPFDFVIGSIHVIDHTEFYYGDFFKNLNKEQAHQAFFEETLRCVKNFDCFNVLGHLDYIMRYGPYEDKKVEHKKYQNIIDEIFKNLIIIPCAIILALISLSYFKEMVYEFKKKNRKNMQFLIKRYILNIIIIIALSLGLQLILNTASIGIIKFLAK